MNRTVISCAALAGIVGAWIVCMPVVLACLVHASDGINDLAAPGDE